MSENVTADGIAACPNPMTFSEALLKAKSRSRRSLVTQQWNKGPSSSSFELCEKLRNISSHMGEVVYTNIYVFIYVYTYVYIYVYIYIYIYIYFYI